jgi:predicted DNA-binding ArsR family transcriptional regulator
MRIQASFRCSMHYGLDKFIDDTKKPLNELKKARMISSYRIADEDTDQDTELCYFNVYADINLSVEEMAEISVNSQTVFMG